VIITYPDGYTPNDIIEINARVNDYADWPLSQVQIEDWERGCRMSRSLAWQPMPKP
jgi:hypothetical protein